MSRTPRKDARPLVERCAAIIVGAGTVFYSRSPDSVARRVGAGWFVGIKGEQNYRLGSSGACVVRRAAEFITARIVRTARTFFAPLFQEENEG